MSKSDEFEGYAANVIKGLEKEIAELKGGVCDSMNKPTAMPLEHVPKGTVERLRDTIIVLRNQIDYLHDEVKRLKGGLRHGSSFYADQYDTMRSERDALRSELADVKAERNEIKKTFEASEFYHLELIGQHKRLKKRLEAKANEWENAQNEGQLEGKMGPAMYRAIAGNIRSLLKEETALDVVNELESILQLGPNSEEYEVLARLRIVLEMEKRNS